MPQDGAPSVAPVPEQPQVPDGNLQVNAPEQNIGAENTDMATDSANMEPAPSESVPDENGGVENAEPQQEENDSTESIINQLSDDDKEAVRNYAKSLLSRDEEQSENQSDEMESPEVAPEQEQGNVMMEITKGRLNKIREAIQESFMDSEKDTERNGKQKKTRKSYGKKSPFDSPLD